MRCRTVQPQLLDFSFDRLEPSAAAAVAAHLQSCRACRRVLGQESDTAALLAQGAPLQSELDAWTTVAAALRRWPTGPLPGRRSRRPLVWSGALVAVAALAFSLIAPSTVVPSLELETLQALAPRAAAGLAPERAPDPLVEAQQRMDRLLDGVMEPGS